MEEKNTHQFKPKKIFGQNFLHDKNIQRKIVSLANVTKKDMVIEIGPGQGALTRRLLKLAKKVIAIEIDKDLEIFFEDLKSDDNFKLFIHSALDFDYNSLLKTEKYENLIVISNLPYYISSQLIFKIIEIQPKIAVLTLQKEMAERLVAKNGTKNYGRFTVSVNSFAKVKKEFNISRNSFFPIPNVESSTITLKDFSIPKIEFFNFCKILFSKKRKIISNNLSQFSIECYDKYSKKRAEQLSIEEIWEIFNCLQK